MPRLTRIYTRTGDEGMTALGSRQRVPKDALRVQAYGAVDELNSMLGFALTQGLSPRMVDLLPVVQNELFHLGSDLSFPEADKETYKIPQIEERHVLALEALIDDLGDAVGPLENFILPGGTPGAAALHVARTICRRAERDVVSLVREEQVGPYVVAYLNRLSDALFMMARYENYYAGKAETLWNSHI